MASAARARVFVIFLDTYHTQLEGSSTMRVPLVRFLDRVLGPDDLVALMTPEMSATDIAFGRKTTVISNIMQTSGTGAGATRVADARSEGEPLRDAATARAWAGQGPAAEMKARRREKLTLDALEDLVVHLGGVREERKAVLTVTEGWVLFREKAIETGQTQPTPPTLSPGRGRPRPTGDDVGRISGSSMIECEADRAVLSAGQPRRTAAAADRRGQPRQRDVLPGVRTRAHRDRRGRVH